jgi:hypothetical protein
MFFTDAEAIFKDLFGCFAFRFTKKKIPPGVEADGELFRRNWPVNL